MAQEKPNPFWEWIGILKERAPMAREHVGIWVERVREEPALVWHTPAVRYGTYTIGAMLVLWVGGALIGMMIPQPANARPRATTADYHVICMNPYCGKEFVIRKPFGFDRFPVECPHCKQRTGERAVRCTSSMCRGRWVIPQEVDDWRRCPHCGDPLN